MFIKCSYDVTLYVTEYEDYLASKEGDIYSQKTDVFMTQTITKGYFTVNLFLNGRGVHVLVNRIIAKTFHPNPKTLPVVHHIDHNKLNNRASNLMWCTHSYNLKQVYASGKRQPPKGTEICQIDINNNVIETYASLHETERKLGMGRERIRAVCEGDRGSTGGVMFRYKTDASWKPSINFSGRNTHVEKVSLETSEVLATFISITAATKDSGGYQSQLSKAIKAEKPYRKFLWRKKVYEVREPRQPEPKIVIDTEGWRPVVDHPAYLISRAAEVYSTKTDIVLKQSTDDEGYWHATLDRQTCPVHRLMLLTYVGEPPEDKPLGNHINCDKGDNNLENLEWSSHVYNTTHAIANGCRKKNGKAKAVRRTNKDGSIVCRTVIEAAKSVGGSEPSIRKACETGKRFKGYKWSWEKKI